MIIDLARLDYTFKEKPLLVGGKAMEYYGLRKSGEDVDFVVSKEDFKELIQKFPEQVKDLYGDLGICTQGFELWKTIDYFYYEFLSRHSIEEKTYKVISLDGLLFQKALAANKPKYQQDLQLIVKKIINSQHQLYNKVKAENQLLTNSLKNVRYLEKKP